ncbi:hypothetical protein THIOM_002937, partial [Candidatus Thiomargarita nelsonii]
MLPSTTLDCTACVIALAPRHLERPSAHAPVVASFEF